MVTIVCQLLGTGVPNDIVRVDMDISGSSLRIAHLMVEIATRHEMLRSYDAPLLQLFCAWACEPLTKILRCRPPSPSPPSIARASSRSSMVFYGIDDGDDDDGGIRAVDRVVHVLVLVPDRLRRYLNLPCSYEFTTWNVETLLFHDVIWHNHHFADFWGPRAPSLDVDAMIAAAHAKVDGYVLTREYVYKQEGVMLGHRLRTQQQARDHQRKSELYYAHAQDGAVLVAQIYQMRYKEQFLHEVEANRTIEAHENVVRFVKCFSVRHWLGKVEFHLITMPFYPRSVGDLIAKCYRASDKFIAMVARDCVAALSHIHAQEYCFGDLKPSNIMLKSSSGGVGGSGSGSAVLVVSARPCGSATRLSSGFQSSAKESTHEAPAISSQARKSSIGTVSEGCWRVSAGMKYRSLLCRKAI